jgi:hypothetical protein
VTAAIAFLVGFAVCLVLLMICTPLIWKGRVLTGPPPAWWLYSEGGFRRYVRGLPTGGAAAANGSFWLFVLAVLDPPQGSTAAIIFVLLACAGMPLYLSVWFLGWPKSLVPPWLRSDAASHHEPDG